MTIYDGDVRLTNTEDGGSIEFRAGQPIMDAGIETAAYISLFTARAWWGNDPGSDIGSDLETILQGRLTSATLNAARDEIQRALAWLISDGVASSVEVTAEPAGIDIVLITITITEPARLSPSTLRYRLNWDAERSHLEARLV